MRPRILRQSRCFVCLGTSFHHPQPGGPAAVAVGAHQPGRPPARASQEWSLPLPFAPPSRTCSSHHPQLPQRAPLHSDIHFKGSRGFSPGFDLLLRHFLEWPLNVCPCPDGIQMQTSPLPPSPPPLQLRSLAPLLGKLILTPTSQPLPHASLALFLRPEVRLRLTPLPASLSKARTSAVLLPASPGPLFNAQVIAL